MRLLDVRLIVILSLAGCDGSGVSGGGSHALGEACAADGDCAGGLSCQHVVAGGLCSKGCANDGDCGAGNVCANGLCRAGCAAPADCNRADFTCAPLGYCDANPVDASAPNDLAIPPNDLASTSNDLAAPSDLATTPDLAKPAMCANGVRDGNETDVDCGGNGCPKCALGKICLQSTDCASGLCQGFVCAVMPTCNDGIQNAAETDIDCGGNACPACANGKKCSVATDCVANNCVNGVCITQSCANGVKDGAETDVDCGGGTCAACGYLKACAKNTDCLGGTCQNQHCAASCIDGVKNGSESDIDCGGGGCPACALGKKCNDNTGCANMWCNAGTCAVNTCTPKFAAGVSFNIANNLGMANGDFNHDGKLDLAFATATSITVLPGRGDGAFFAPIVTMINLTGGIGGARVDWNGDGFADLASFPNSNIQPLINNGDGTFKAGAITPLADTGELFFGDFNGDGRSDILGSSGNNTANWQIDEQIGNGDGTFAVTTTVVGGVSCGKMCGLVDVAIAHAGGKDVHVYTTTGIGNHKLCIGKVCTNFGIMYGGWASAVLAGDFDGDGLDDVVMSQGNASGSVNGQMFNWSTSLSNGGIRFFYELPNLVPTRGTGPLGDWNGDGKLDAFASQTQLRCGNGDGSFTPPVAFSSMSMALAGDYNGDKKSDWFLLANGTITLQLNAN